MSAIRAGTHRRGFLGGMAAGVAALLVGRPSTADAHVTGLGTIADEPWMARLKGTQRQVVDCTAHNGGFGAAYALNYMDTTRQVLGLPESDFSSVVSYRHMAMPLMLNDAMWAKYKVGELLNVMDPKTNAPATRNIFAAGILGRPGLTYEQAMATRPVIMTACNLALGLVSGMAAPKAGVTPEQAKADWTGNLLKGAHLVPSGVYAVHRAQQSGCTYCNGG